MDFRPTRNFFARDGSLGSSPNPQHFSADTRIEVALKQLGQIDSKPAIVRRVRLALSGDPGWTAYGAEPNRVAAVARLKDLKKRLAKIPAVDVPVMSEETTLRTEGHPGI